MSGVDIACSSGKNRRSTRLHNIKVCQQKKPKQHPASRGPLKRPDEEPSSTSKTVENHDSDIVVPDNVPGNLPEISSDGKYLDMFVNDLYVCLFMSYLFNVSSLPIPTVSMSWYFNCCRSLGKFCSYFFGIAGKGHERLQQVLH